MELTEEWVPEVTEREVERDGILLDEKYDPCPDADINNKVLCKLYYLKSKDLFATISDGMTDMYSALPLHIITSEFIIDGLKHKYFNMEHRAHSKNAFMEYDDTEYAGFQPELDLSTADAIKKHGKLLQTLVTTEIYYIESIDRFASVNKTDGMFYMFDSPDHRKKYDIPYQDERFN